VTGGGAHHAAAQRGVQHTQAVDLEGDGAGAGFAGRGADGAAPSAHRPPGSINCGRIRLSSDCQRASSSRASSARLASAWSMAGLYSLSSGRTEWRMRLRVKAWSAFVESVRQPWLRDSRKSMRSARRMASSGAEFCRCARDRDLRAAGLRRDLWALRREL